jgi:hypothetical protein
MLPVFDAASLPLFIEPLAKIAKELTEQGRAQIKDENFVFPKQEKYPIHDRQHAIAALGFSKMHASPSTHEKVRAAVEKKYPGVVSEKKAAVPAKETRHSWKVSNARSGKRPMSVDTLLRKEKEGTLHAKLGQALLKISQFYGPVLPFTDAPDKGAAPTPKRRTDNIPSADDISSQGLKREDGRDFLATEMARGTNLNEIATTNQPQEKTARLANYLASKELHGDLGGLSLMALSSADRLRSQLKHPQNDQKGSLMGGDVGRTGADLAGLGMMVAPTLGAMVSAPSKNRFTNVANLAGLTALAVPTLDKLQANIRARRAGVDPEQKMLLGHKAHALAELGGYGTLAAPVIRNARTAPIKSTLATLGGYGTLAAPIVEDLAQHDENKKIFKGPARSVAELAGLSLLGGGALMHGH